MKNLFKLTNITKILICAFLFVLTVTPNSVFAVTNTKKVSAINGRVTVTFKYAVTTPKVTDFVVSQSINKGTAKTIKASKVTINSTKKIVTLTIPVVAKTSVIQSIVYKVSYKKDTVVSSPAISVAKVTVAKLGDIKGVVTWQYNTYVGTKPDTGAKIALIPVNEDNTKDNSLFSLLIQQIPQGENGIYTGKADGYGSYEIDNVPAGQYYMLMVSSNTTSDMTIDAGSQQILSSLFSAKDWTTMQLCLKLNKFLLQSVEVKQNATIIESNDFGNTYF